VLDFITALLYPAIAKEYGTSPEKVERAIRHAIDVAWSRVMADSIDNVYGYPINKHKGKPTSSELIAIIAEGLRLEYPEGDRKRA